MFLGWLVMRPPAAVNTKEAPRQENCSEDPVSDAQRPLGCSEAGHRRLLERAHVVWTEVRTAESHRALLVNGSLAQLPVGSLPPIRVRSLVALGKGADGWKPPRPTWRRTLAMTASGQRRRSSGPRCSPSPLAPETLSGRRGGDECVCQWLPAVSGLIAPIALGMG